MAVNYLQQLYSYTTLAEGKDIINENFNELVDYLNTLNAEGIAELINNGLVTGEIFGNKADKAENFQVGNLVEFDDDGNLFDSNIASSSIVELDSTTNRIPASSWIQDGLTEVFVDANLGDDTNFSGTDIAHPVKTIKRAVEKANEILTNAALAQPEEALSNVTGVTIRVAAGDYEENNPIQLPARVSVTGTDLRNVRLFAENPNLDFFHVKSLNYLANLRFMQLRRPAFSVAFPSAIADSTLVNKSINSISVLYSPSGYVGTPEIKIDPPDEEGGTQATATAIMDGGVISSIQIDNPGDGYLKRPYISIAAPKNQQPIIIGSTYVQNCSSITGPFDTNGDLISPLAPLPYDFENGFTYTDVNTGETISHAPVDEEGAGGGMRIDGRVVFGYNNLSDNEGFKSPLRSMVADSFTQVNQGGPGHLITNIGYAQFVSCFTTFCTYSFKAKNGGFANISNSVTDFGDLGLVAEGYQEEPYTTGNSSVTLSSTVGNVNVLNAGAGYDDNSPPNVSITGGGGSGALAEAVVENGIVVRIDVTDPGENYTSQPSVVIDAPPSGGTQATAEVVLQKINQIEVQNLDTDTQGKIRRPDVGSVVRFGGYEDPNGQWSFISNVIQQPAPNDDKFLVSFTPGIESIIQGDALKFNQRSNLSTGSHVFEFGGAGVTYNALPEYGGVPNPEKEVEYSEPAQVYFTSNDNLGNLKIGDFFAVEQATGAVTINTDVFNLSGLNAIGPFRVDGIPYGVVLRELTNKPTLQADSGLNDNTAATVSAIRGYIANRSLFTFSDVDYPTPSEGNPFGGDFLRWDSINLQWKNSTANLGELNDVDLNVVTPENGFALIYGTNDEWRAGIPSSAQALNNGSGTVITTDQVSNHITSTSNPHNVSATQINAISNTEKGQPDGVAPLDSTGVIPDSFLPPLTLGSVEVVADIAERDLISPVAEGDIARVLDSDGAGNPATFIYDDVNGWVLFDSPQQVTSVNSLVGDVYLTTSNIDEGSNEYYTQQKVENVIDSRVDADFVNAFNLSAQELRDSADPSVVVDAVEVDTHVNNIFDPSAIPTSGPNQGKNPHGITPALIGAYADDTTTDGISEGTSNLYYTESRVTNLVNRNYVNSLSVDAQLLDGVVASQFLRSDENDSFSGTILGNKINLGSSPLVDDANARLEVNGYMRTGSIFLHAQGATPEEPQGSSLPLTNFSGELQWNGSTVWTASNDGIGSGLDADTIDALDSTDLLDRTNHTGTQTVSTISDFDANVNNLITNFTSNDVTFASNVSVNGDLTVTGSLTSLNTIDMVVEDSFITLNSGQPTAFNDVGIVMQRFETPTTENFNVAFVWDEEADEFRFGATTSIGTESNFTEGDERDVAFLNEGIFATLSSNGTFNASEITKAGVPTITSNDVASIRRVTRDEYDALTPEEGVLYIVIG